MMTFLVYEQGISTEEQTVSINMIVYSYHMKYGNSEARPFQLPTCNHHTTAINTFAIPNQVLQIP